MTNRIRNASAALLFLVCLVTLTSAFNLPNRSLGLSSRLASLSTVTKPAQQRKVLTLADRVAYQRAIEDVYWRHRIWPKERPDPKPSLDAVMSQAQLEKKVEDYLRKSQALEDYWHHPITAEQLQAEMDRMAKHTKQPEVLRELFAALGNDPFVIAECLARSILAERLIGDITRRVEDGEIDISKSDAKKPRTPTPKAFASPKDFVRKPEDLTLFREAFGARPRPRVALALYPSVRRISMNARDVAGATNLNNAAYKLPEISIANGCADDTWTATTIVNAPDVRASHTAVWTGSEMIVWGGSNQNGSQTHTLHTGGRYSPSTDSWTATAIANAPLGRASHTAVWTGSEMIVWGGSNFPVGPLNTGGRYNPVTDSWTPTSTVNVPFARASHTAVWTGSEMIIWGGINTDNTGGRYNPSTDSWAATSTTNAPAGRLAHSAVWTGSEMIIWGGTDFSTLFNTGGRYNPGTNSWIATTTANAPSGRQFHTAVWRGNEMIVWAGDDGSKFGVNSGGRYSPATNGWVTTSTINAPAGRFSHTAVWTGSEMIAWGGTNMSNNLNTGGRYNPGTDNWVATTTANVPAGRAGHTAIWSGSEMIVWGGVTSNYVNTGGRYCAQSQAPMAQSALSRKTHGAAGTFDVPLPLTGNVGIECRSGATNDYQMIINFATSVTVESASVTSGTGSVSSFTVNGSQVTVNLTGVTNVQRITVTLFNVNDGTHRGNVPVSMGVLIGDVNGNAAVNATDVALTKSQVGMAVGSGNFREDVNANGTISATDVAIVKSDVGTSLPP